MRNKVIMYDRGVGTIGTHCDPGSEPYASACYKSDYNHDICKRTALCSIQCSQ